MALSEKRLASERERLNKLKSYEEMIFQEGFSLIAGIDEVGRGCIAGPVVAGAVILPRDFFLPGVNDSKLLNEKLRRKLAGEIKHNAKAWSVAVVSSAFIDRENILIATREAMRLAVEELWPTPDFLLVDALEVPRLPIRQYSLIKGDSLSISIACASIIAKVERDQIMQHYESLYPGYYFAKHKGYATAQHIQALRQLGACPLHRCSFEPVKSLTGGEYGTQANLFT